MDHLLKENTKCREIVCREKKRMGGNGENAENNHPFPALLNLKNAVQG